MKIADESEWMEDVIIMDSQFITSLQWNEKTMKLQNYPKDKLKRKFGKRDIFAVKL